DTPSRRYCEQHVDRARPADRASREARSCLNRTAGRGAPADARRPAARWIHERRHFARARDGGARERAVQRRPSAALGAQRPQPRTLVLPSAAMGVVVVLALLASGLTFTTPDGWQQSPPGSSMRVAEFTLPRASGDAEDAQLVVYYFGGSGGSV